MYEIVRNTYEYFFSIVSGYSSYELKNTKRDKTLINNFIKLIPDEASEDWIFNFFAFQFFRYHDKKTRFEKGCVLLNWVVGQKALDAWDNITEEQRFLTDEFLSKYKIKNQRVIKTNKLSNSFYLNEKKRFYNTEEGFLNCVEFGIKKCSDDLCKKCMHKKFCK